MGQPEKDEPKDIPPAAAELIENIDSYQKRVENEWDTAKAAYQSKINQIMEEFLKQGFTVEQPDAPASPPPRSSPKDRPEFEQPTPQKNSAQDPYIAKLLSRVEQELRNADIKSRKLSFFSSRPSSAFQLDWKPTGLQGLVHRVRRFAPLLAVAAIAAGLFVWLMTPSMTILPYAHTLGPIVTKDKIYIVDWFRKSLYVHANKHGYPILSVENLPNTFPTGMAMDGKAVWSLDDMSHKLLKHATTIDHQVMSSFDTPGSQPIGLFFDGTDLWSGDQTARKIYRHRGNDVEDIRDEFTLPDGTLSALAIRDNRLWLLDGKSRELAVYRLQKPLRQLGIFDLDPFLKGATPSGFYLEGKTVWVVTENPSALIKIPLKKLEKSKTDVF